MLRLQKLIARSTFILNELLMLIRRVVNILNLFYSVISYAISVIDIKRFKLYVLLVGDFIYGEMAFLAI